MKNRAAADRFFPPCRTSGGDGRPRLGKSVGRSVGALLMLLSLNACRPSDENAANAGGPPAYVAPAPEPRRNPHPSPEVHQWLQASQSVRTQLAKLHAELASLQQIHLENHFDDFLKLDPATMEPAQLYYLQHFLEHGHFRIERETLLQLLETTRSRQAASASLSPASISTFSPESNSDSNADSNSDSAIAPPPAAPPTSDIAARLQSALRRDETLLIDLETAIERYRSTGEDPIQIPPIISEEELQRTREKVANLLKTERLKIGELDGKIAALRAAR